MSSESQDSLVTDSTLYCRCENNFQENVSQISGCNQIPSSEPATSVIKQDALSPGFWFCALRVYLRFVDIYEDKQQTKTTIWTSFLFQHLTDNSGKFSDVNILFHKAKIFSQKQLGNSKTAPRVIQQFHR